MNKKAIQLSVNFLVMLIIAIVIFGFGIKFIYSIIKESETLRDITLEELDDQIEELLCESSDKVCLGINTKTMERGDIHIFGIKVINMDDNPHDFTVSIEESGYVSKGGDYDSSFPTNTDIEFKPETRTETIKSHEEKDMGVGFYIKKASSGKYIFTVYACYDGTTGNTCQISGLDSLKKYDSPKKIYITVP